MNSNAPTAPRARDLALFEKQALRAGLDLHGLSVAQLADMLGVEDDTVEAWVSPSRPNHVPRWIDSHPRFPRTLREFLRAESDRRAGEPPRFGADSPETQSLVALRTVGQFVTAVAATIAGDIGPSGRITSEAAAQLYTISEKAHASLGALCAHLSRRVITGRHVARGGQS